MEFFDSIIALFPIIGVAAILIRYIVEAGKKFEFKLIAEHPGRAQAVLNAIAWLGMGLAAHFGAEAQALVLIQRVTDAFPGVLGLLELVIPMFLSILATKVAHEALKTTESTAAAEEEAPKQAASATSEVSPEGVQRMTLQVGATAEAPGPAVVDTIQYGTGAIDPKS